MEPAVTTNPSARAALVLRSVYTAGEIVFREDVMRAPGFTIGRTPNSARDLRFGDDLRMSREHARITIRGDSAEIENLSRNATFKNGVEVAAREPLQDGDVLRMGETFFVVRSLPSDLHDAEVPELVGRSPAAVVLRSLIDTIGATKASVVLLGETGVGKDVTARALHRRSGRKGPLVAVNCAAVPSELAESQFFGHRAGAFTGAVKDATGFFRDADAGTLFLDEIGELPIAMQAVLLRVLDEHAVTPVGATRAVPVDVRIIAATNRRLPEDVAAGRFRPDLWARLSEVTIRLPPLRQRTEDVLQLFQHALPGKRISPGLAERLLLHPWPLNVRELVKLTKELSAKGANMAVLSSSLVRDSLLTLRGEAETGEQTPISASEDESSSAVTRPLLRPKSARVKEPTSAQLIELLQIHGGKVSVVARELGWSRTQVYRWLEQHGIDPEAYRQG